MTTFETSPSSFSPYRNPIESQRITTTYHAERIAQLQPSSASRDDEQLFTDPELLRSIQMSSRDIGRATPGTNSRPVSQANSYMNSLNSAVKDNRTAQYATETRPNSTSFVIDTKPAQELYVDNTNVPPPTHFYYTNPQQSLSSNQLHYNQYQTYVVSSGEAVNPTQQIVKPPFFQPSFMASPSTVIRQSPTPILSNPQSVERPIQKSHSAIRINSDMVPRAQYERCQNQCRIWQEKYNELYKRLSNTPQRKEPSTDGEINRLRQENYELEQRLINYERTEHTVQQNIEAHITELINKYRNSALKQCQLLYDRFKLQCRQMERNGNTVYYA